MSDNRIFIKKEIICPSCKIGSLQKYPNPKLYAAGSRDDDKRITSYNWAGGIKTDIQPHHYAVLQCPNCMFADFRETFETPKNSNKDKALYETLHDIPFDRRLILRKFRRFIPKEQLNAEGAIALHLCALYITLLPENEDLIDHMKLGRLSLRLSWLYREYMGPTIAKTQEASTGTEIIPNTITNISKHLVELRQSSEQISKILNHLFHKVEDRSKELSCPGGKNPYSAGLKNLSDGLQTIQNGITILQQTLELDKSGNLKAASSDNDSNSINLKAIFQSLIPQWPTLPQNEISAIKMAVKAFDYSFKHEETDENIKQSMALVNTIIKLLIKIGELEQALDYIQQIYKSGFRDKQNLQMRLNQGKRDKSVNEVEAKSLTRQIGIINNTLAMAAETRKGIFEKLFERDKEQILNILNAKVDVVPREQEQALIDAGYHAELITFLREKQLIKTEVKKKKWFG